MWLRSAIVALAAVHAASAEEFSGDMTAYTLGQPSSGNCNFMSSAPQASVNYAALNTPQWAGTKNCGRCALVSCVDSRCSDHSKTELVYILDRCPECQYGDLDVSPSVFKSLTGSDPSRYKIKWSFVDCPVTGNIKYCLKGGSNPFWTAIQPANTVTGVASMAINSKATGMVDSAYYYLLNGQSTTQTDLSAVQITLTSVSGEVIRDTVSLSAGSCTDGAHQFSRGTAPNPAPAPAPAPVTPPATPKSTPAPVPTTKAPVSTTTTPGSTTTTPSATQSTSNNSTVAGDADNTDASQDDAPGKVKAPDATGSSDTQTSEDRTGTDESGELTDTASPSTTPATSSGGSGATETNTRSQATSKTSPALVVLASLAAVGMVALAIVAVVVKRKRLMDKEADRDDSLMIVNLRSFDTMTTPANVPGAHQQQQRTDFAVL